MHVRHDLFNFELEHLGFGNRKLRHSAEQAACMRFLYF